MDEPKQTKEKVREYMERRQMERRQSSRSPLHGPEQIRHEIGWDMVERRRQDRRNDESGDASRDAAPVSKPRQRRL